MELEHKGLVLARPGKSQPDQVNGNQSQSHEHQVKQCSKCRKVKPLAAFYFNQKKLKADSQCVDCKKAGVKSRRKNVAEVVERMVAKPLEEYRHKEPSSILTGDEFAQVLQVFEKLRQWRDQVV